MESFVMEHPKIFVLLPVITTVVFGLGYLMLMALFGLMDHGDPDSEYELWKADRKKEGIAE